LFCLIFFGIAAAQDSQVVDRIVAVVNDDIILLSELNRVFDPYAENIRRRGLPIEEERAMLFKVREEILSHLIDRKLTDQESKRLGITVSDKEIDSAIERIKEANFYTDESMREALEKEGMTMEEYREQMEEQILRSKLVNFEVRSKIIITKEDIASYYESHKDVYQGKKKYHFRNILMKAPAEDDKKIEVKEKMEIILARLKAGEPFEKLAEKYSELPSAAKGGDLGVFEYDVLSPQLKEAIKGLNTGDVTPVLDTDLGYQIFFIQEIVEPESKSLEEALPEIEENLYKEIVDSKFKSWLEDLRKRSHIKIIR
jgi:peptidyl-prolyl cis-trans isomerase SurA